MKKAVLFILLFFMCANCAFSQNEVNFIYINGSNTNDEKNKLWFFNGVEKFHTVLVKKINSDPFMSKKLTQDGCYCLANEPSYLFWGDLTKYQI